MQLSKELGRTQKTAWFMLHRIRALCDTGLAALNGIVEYVNGMAHANGIESVWAFLKRGYHGIYHNFSTKRLQRYINEFTFRLNEGNCQIDTKDRMVSLFKGIGNNRISYKELTA